MTPEFSNWWAVDHVLSKDNPYEKYEPIWWAWEGWQANQRSNGRLRHRIECMREALLMAASSAYGFALFDLGRFCVNCAGDAEPPASEDAEIESLREQVAELADAFAALWISESREAWDGKAIERFDALLAKVGAGVRGDAT